MQSSRYSCQILMEHEFSRQIFEKYSSIKFHKNPSIGSRFVPCGRTDGQKDTTKLIVAFCSLVNAPKNSIFSRPEPFAIKVFLSNISPMNWEARSSSAFLHKYKIKTTTFGHQSASNTAPHPKIRPQLHYCESPKTRKVNCIIRCVLWDN
jgi:hypothetical protein